MTAAKGGSTLLFQVLLLALVVGLSGCGGGGGGTSSGGAASGTLPTVPTAVSLNPSSGAAVVTAAQDTNPALAGIQTDLIVSGLPPNQIVKLFLASLPKAVFSQEQPSATAMTDSNGTAKFTNVTLTENQSLSVTNEQGSTLLTTQTRMNRAPTASVGQAVSGVAGTAVTIAGQASDPDGDALSYLWSQVSGTSVTITNANAASASFTPAAAGTFVFKLTVADPLGERGSAELTVTVTAQASTNQAPTANAGNDQTVNTNTQVTLTGAGSDPNTGDTLTYTWTQVSNSAPTVTLGGTGRIRTFTPSTAGTYVFTLTVSDGTLSATDNVTVTVNQQQQLHTAPEVAAAAAPSPLLAASATPSVAVQTNVTLRVTVQKLYDGATVSSYLWEQTSPASPLLTINNASAAIANVTPATVGSYTFRVTVTDNQGGVATSSVNLNVTPANVKPIANAGPAQFGVGYDTLVTLNGALSSDPDGATPTFKWTQSASDKKKVTLQGATTANPTFVTTGIAGIYEASGYTFTAAEYGVVAMPSNAAGVYNFTLTVQDSLGLTATNTVEVFSAWRNNGTTSGEVGAHVYFVAPITQSYNWTLTGPTGSTAQLSGANTRFPKLVPDKAGIYTVKEGNRAPIKYNASTFAGQSNCAGCHGPDTSLPDKVTSFNGTIHATLLKSRLNRAGAVTLSTLRSRTVGFNPTVTAVSGWDDDYAKAQSNGFSFPASLPLNYYDTTFPAELKALGNQQCETCHGPGTNHFGNKQKIAKTYSAAVCGQCHGTQPAELAKAKHNGIVASPASRGNVSTGAGCTACHNGPAYVAVTSAFPTTGTIKAWNSTTNWMSVADSNKTTTGFGASAHTCAVCHDPHASPKGSLVDFQLRVFDRDITLIDNKTVLTKTGASATCITCHHARTSASTIPVTTVTAVSGNSYGSRLGMHYSPQADVLFGVNGSEFTGEQYSNSEHKNVVEGLCVECHMATDAPRGTPSEAGGHTWKMKKASGASNVGPACTKCHTDLITYDRTARADYDGDGKVEGIQTEVHGLLDEIDEAMEVATVPVTITTTTNGVQSVVTKSAWAHYKLTEYAYKLTPDQMKVAWNWRLIEEDRSFGVHNAAYTVQLLQKSYKLATGHDIPNAVLRPARKM